MFLSFYFIISNLILILYNYGKHGHLREAFKIQHSKIERPWCHLLTHLLANPPCHPLPTKTGLYLLPEVLTQSRKCIFKPSKPQSLPNQADTKGWIFIGDTPKDFAILQSGPKMQQVLSQTLRCHFQSHTTLHRPRKVNFWF